jgi:hypothetical protein
LDKFISDNMQKVVRERAATIDGQTVKLKQGSG